MKKLNLIILFVFSVILINAQEFDSDQIQEQTPGQPEFQDTIPVYEETILDTIVYREETKNKNKGKGSSYITIGGGIGPSGLKYDLKGFYSDGDNKLKLGGNALLGYSYFFNKTIGLGTGLGIGYYRSSGLYKGDFRNDGFISLGNQVNDDPDNLEGLGPDYELRLRLRNWEERQKAFFLEIPILLQLQHRFGRVQRHGIYFSVGAKFQIPIKSTYEVIDGDNSGDQRLNVSGAHPDTGSDYGAPGSPPLNFHGFASIYNPNETLNWNGDMDIKMSIAGTAELGFIFGLNRRLDLLLGAYIDYGFNNLIKDKERSQLFTPPQEYLPEANYNVGKGISYSGVVNSDRVEKTNLMSYGAKIGLRIKLGRPNEFIDPYIQKEIIRETIIIIKDTCCGAGPEVKEDSVKGVSIKLRGVVRDVTDPSHIKYLDNAKILAYNEGLLLGEYNTTDSGKFGFDLSQNQNYRIRAEYPNYLANAAYFSTGTYDKDTVIDIVIDLNSLEIKKPIELPIIEYEFDKWNIKPESADSLNNLIRTLNENPNITIELRAHTDYRGSDSYNMELSQKRAQSCVDYLVSKGIERDRLVAKGLGESEPKVVDRNTAKKYPYLGVGDILTEQYILKLNSRQQEVANQLNRRTEFSVLSTNYVSKKK